jgi:outer membrane cobalamin receptor
MFEDGILESPKINHIILPFCSAIALYLVCLGVPCSTAAVAANVSPMEAARNNDLTELSIEDLMNLTVTSASKKPESISHAPASVFVITQDDIRRYGYRTLGEALQRVAGLYISSDRNYDYLGVRGFARPGDYNARVLVLIDGNRINDALYDSSAIGEDLPLNMNDVERIEVVKGPGSALWGTNALLAVVNLITKKGKDIDGIGVTADYGSHRRMDILIEAGGVSKHGLEVAGSFSTMNSNGQSRIYFPEFDAPSTNNGVAEGVDGEESQRGHLSASYKGLKFFAYSGRRKKYVPTASWGGLVQHAIIHCRQ